MVSKVKFKDVSKSFKMYSKNTNKIMDLLFNNTKIDQHHALSHISFEVNEGEVVGVIGLNGSGKSTLSNLIAGVTLPTEGEVEINGNATLISISAGLSNTLTGMDNIELKGLMMGLSKKEIKSITPSIIEFAELGKFIDQPVKTYSSGMKARLGFSISVHIDPDILVIDEALSVGDQTFANKCLKKVNEFKDDNKTIFFISHSLSQVHEFCNKAIWLHQGKLMAYGDIDSVLKEYKNFLNDYNSLSENDKLKIQ